jgi:ketosteroid isomerase-like protein
MSADALAQVEEANARFYRAFEALALDRMDAVWAHTAGVQCVHPGWPRIVGWDAVRSSWETIFSNTTEMRFTISDVRVAGGPEVAWVTCTENILSEVGDRVSVTALLATNVFERDGDDWRMVLHHASHVLGRSSADA